MVVRASTGILRDEDDFSEIRKQNKYDIERFTVTFKDYNDGKDCSCVRNLELEKSTHLAFERGILYIREGDRAYQAHPAVEISKLIYVKKGITHIYPTAFNSKFDIT